MIGFQFTHPGKGATEMPNADIEAVVFQFTHPGKGATLAAVSKIGMQAVSIHTPWEGCDVMKRAVLPP